MKKAIAFFSALLLLSCCILASCGQNGQRKSGTDSNTEITEKTGGDSTGTARKDETTMEDTAKVTETAPVDPYSGASLVSWMHDGCNKITENTAAPEVCAKEITVTLPRGQTENCQISFLSDMPVYDLTLSVSAGDPGISLEPMVEHTILITGKRWPDGLVPLSVEGSFTLKKNKALTLLIKCTAAEDAGAGDHIFTLTLRDKDGRTVDTYTVTVHVWDFSCEKTPIRTWVPLCKESIALYYGLGNTRVETLDAEKQAELDRLYKLYYDFLLEYGISGGELPYDILDDRADAYMSDPRVTSFSIGQMEPDKEHLAAVYKKLKTNPEWLEKGVYYALDEPTDPAMLDQLAAYTREVKKIAPDLKVVSAYYSNFTHNNGQDATQFLMDTLDIICPKLCCWNNFGGFSTFRKRISAYKEEGHEVWTYVCWEPGKPYTNLFVNEEGLDHRILFWQIYNSGADAFLYWCANKWYDIEVGNPWNSMNTIPWIRRLVPSLTEDIYGDGSFLYPGKDFGIDGPCGSFRLEQIREGIEDIALLKKAEEVLGTDWVNGKIAKVTVGVTQYISSSANFLKVRNEIGSALEEKLKG